MLTLSSKFYLSHSFVLIISFWDLIQIEKFKMDLKTRFQEIYCLKTCFQNDPIWLPKIRLSLLHFVMKAFQMTIEQWFEELFKWPIQIPYHSNTISTFRDGDKWLSPILGSLIVLTRLNVLSKSNPTFKSIQLFSRLWEYKSKSFSCRGKAYPRW